MSILSPFCITNPRLKSTSPRVCSIMRRFSNGKLPGSMTDTVTDTKLSTLLPVVASKTRQSSTFLDACSEQVILFLANLLCGIQREMEAGTLPKFVARLMEELCSKVNPGAEHIVLTNMSLALDRILSDVKNPFEFSPYLEAIREPFNYHVFVQNYIRPLINLRLVRNLCIMIAFT
nr:glycerol-3-phosphate acyltransferase, chloroplastic [Tanacetum cinerariifolium]